MTLLVGARLGPYEITGALGAGGMGEVFRARDTRLNRDVAIKVLPAAFADDPQRVARFTREAQTLASLNHPNIAAIHGIEEVQLKGDSGSGSRALVMELVEGDDLSVHIARGPVALEDALPIARQIAEALEAAHEQGIIHRDLKPANIKVRSDGTVKVLDFGLAKAIDPAGTSSGAAMNSPTMTARATEMGMILGTAAYMAPEQARGKAVDRRADIWAFGVVLYEMLTGRRTFAGDSTSDVLAAVLRQDMDWTALPATTPPAVRQLLTRCLDRDVRLRLRDIGEARVLLADPAALASAAPTVAPAVPSGWRAWAWTTTALLLVVSAIAIWGWGDRPAPPSLTVTRAAILKNGFARDVALSRDGARMAYHEMSDGGRIVLRMMDQLEALPVPGTEAGTDPAFSPDGQSIAFMAGSVIKTIPLTGGTAKAVYDIPNEDQSKSGYVSLTWTDETLLFGSTKGLMRVKAAGGTPEGVTTVNTNDGEKWHGHADVLPGGRSLIFTVMGNSASTSRVAVLDIATRTSRVIVDGAERGRYLPTGHLVYWRARTLFAVMFDLKTLTVTGSETPMLEGISSDFAISDTGVLVLSKYPTLLGGFKQTLEWLDRSGARQPLAASSAAWTQIALSPDGKWVAGAVWEEGTSPRRDIWKYDVARPTLTRMTFDGSSDAPVWSRDSQWIAFSSGPRDRRAIYRVSVNASGPPELLVPATSGVGIRPVSWAPDGTLLYVRHPEDPAKERYQVWVLPPPGAGDRTPRRLLQTASNELYAHVSPDGKWVAYQSDESGKDEVYVVPFSGSGPKRKISTNGGDSPKWSGSGKELYYFGVGDGVSDGVSDGPKVPPVMVVAVDQTALGLPQPLFSVRLFGGFDVAPGLRNFLILPGREEIEQFEVITNWFVELGRRVPIAK